MIQRQGIPKWKRLAAAFDARQRMDRCSNKVIEFILGSMRPVRFMNRPEIFEDRRATLNHVLISADLSWDPMDNSDSELLPANSRKLKNGPQSFGPNF